jgi:hypothetical protein
MSFRLSRSITKQFQSRQCCRLSMLLSIPGPPLRLSDVAKGNPQKFPEALSAPLKETIFSHLQVWVYPLCVSDLTERGSCAIIIPSIR